MTRHKDKANPAPSLKQHAHIRHEERRHREVGETVAGRDRRLPRVGGEKEGSGRKPPFRGQVKFVPSLRFELGGVLKLALLSWTTSSWFSSDGLLSLRSVRVAFPRGFSVNRWNPFPTKMKPTGGFSLLEFALFWVLELMLRLNL
jgi:hypothetical protein